MKKKCIAVALSVALGITSFQGCIGSFGLTGKVYKFNRSLGNKWIQWVGFLILVIVPIYGIAILADGIIFNSIEFWTGSNPVAMKPGEKEVQYVREDGKLYRIEATQNRFHILQLEGPNTGDSVDFVYNPETKTWLVGNGRDLKRVAQFSDQSEYVKVFKADGNSVMVDINSSPAEVYETLGLNM